MGQTLIVVGAQWGDEGKGKIVDMLSAGHDCVVRFQGGNNAGHTLVVDGEKIILHTIPSGVLYPDKINIIGSGVVLDPDVCLKEIHYLKSRGHLTIDENLKISSRVNLIMPYHRLIDVASEKKKGENKIGTTGRGIGPAYTDKAARKGIRICDVLYNPAAFRDELAEILDEKNFLLKKYYGEKPVEIDSVYDEYVEYAGALRTYICDTAVFVDKALRCGKKVLFEGAQGILLDVDHGTYPFVTSSSTVAGSVLSGTPVSARYIERILGVAKAYTTRVGEGPFPTELTGDEGELLRKKGQEFGATTGRPRRCGWIDLVALRYAVVVSGITELAITKLDILSGLESLKVCVSYNIDGNIVDCFPPTREILTSSTPVFQEFSGWSDDISKVEEFSDLPGNAKKYITFIEDFLAVPVTIISVSPERSGIIRKG